MTMIEHDITQI